MSNIVKRILSSIVLIPLALFFIIKGSSILILFTTFLFIVACYEWQIMTKNRPYNVYGFIFLIISFYTFYYLSIDYWNVFFVILICISTDVGGYIFGKLFGGPKLTKISPNKTYSGMIGSYLLSLICLSIVSIYIYDQVKLDFKFYLMIILLSTVSQVGDLVVSFFKRLSNFKNTGKLIPGHGGLLDRIDGMIFAFPTFYLIKFFGFVNL